MPGNHTLMVCSKTYSYEKSVRGIPWGGNRPAPASLVHPPKAGPELQDPWDRAGGLGRWEGQSPPPTASHHTAFSLLEAGLQLPGCKNTSWREKLSISKS